MIMSSPLRNTVGRGDQPLKIMAKANVIQFIHLLISYSLSTNSLPVTILEKGIDKVRKKTRSLISFHWYPGDPLKDRY